MAKVDVEDLKKQQKWISKIEDEVLNHKINQVNDMIDNTLLNTKSYNAIDETFTGLITEEQYLTNGLIYLDNIPVNQVISVLDESGIVIPTSSVNLKTGRIILGASSPKVKVIYRIGFDAKDLPQDIVKLAEDLTVEELNRMTENTYGYSDKTIGSSLSLNLKDDLTYEQKRIVGRYKNVSI